ncbi:hypothetical protein M0R45_037881 [Rubus argutus]|uniref:Uncharacterized protein n=1 Tax=Rubus argutus TaxID=59490 RepID=A0AAW1W0U7_RUBAR
MVNSTQARSHRRPSVSSACHQSSFGSNRPLKPKQQVQQTRSKIRWSKPNSVSKLVQSTCLTNPVLKTRPIPPESSRPETS